MWRGGAGGQALCDEGVTRGGGGGQNFQIYRDVFCGWPLSPWYPSLRWIGRCRDFIIVFISLKEALLFICSFSDPAFALVERITTQKHGFRANFQQRIFFSNFFLNAFIIVLSLWDIHFFSYNRKWRPNFNANGGKASSSSYFRWKIVLILAFSSNKDIK